jgi:hypothetical protein
LSAWPCSCPAAEVLSRGLVVVAGTEAVLSCGAAASSGREQERGVRGREAPSLARQERQRGGGVRVGEARARPCGEDGGGAVEEVDDRGGEGGAKFTDSRWLGRETIHLSQLKRHVSPTQVVWCLQI